MDNSTLQEIAKLWDKCNEIEKKLSNFTDTKVAEVTPYTETKTAYIGDTEVVFDVQMNGNLSVFVKDTEGNYPDYAVERTGDRITVEFEPLEYVTTITISILKDKENES